MELEDDTAIGYLRGSKIPKNMLEELNAQIHADRSLLLVRCSHFQIFPFHFCLTGKSCVSNLFCGYYFLCLLLACEGKTKFYFFFICKFR